jgi:enamine deaminase RidA (YjgF/YER057c/UK114 family)
MAHANLRILRRKRKIEARAFASKHCAKVSRHSSTEHTISSMAITPEARIRELGIVLPSPAAPGGNYVFAKTVGSLVYLAGVISADASGILSGTAGLNRSIEEGYAAARACALIQLSALQKHLGSLDLVKGIVAVTGYVNSAPGFPDSPKVINGASDLLVEILGDAGRHVRAAIGVSGLPRNALVELQVIAEI